MRIFLRDAAAEAPRDHSLLVDAIALLADTVPSRVELLTRCRRCGSPDHGKPRVVSPAAPGGAEYHASLSRAGGLVAVAVTTDAPVGVDIERAAAVSRRSIDRAALHPDENSDLQRLPEERRDERRVLLWTAKEAVLKAAGVGLNVDPSLLALRVRGDDVALVRWPAVLAVETVPRIRMFEPGQGLVGALATWGRLGSIELARLP